MIFDPSGKTILEISQPDATNPGGLVFQSGTDLSSEPVVQPVLRGDYDALGDKYIGYIGSPPRALAAAGPVLLGDRVVGGVLVQTPLADLLTEMQTKAQAEGALLDSGGPLLGGPGPRPKGGGVVERPPPPLPPAPPPPARRPKP